MKNLKLLAAAVAVVLAGCAQTPDSVRFSAEKDSTYLPTNSVMT